MYDDGCGHHKCILCSTAFWRREAAVQGADGAACLALDAQPAAGERVARSAARAHTTPLSARSSPPHYMDNSTHTLVPLSSIPGFKLQEQQRCQICNRATSWACAECSKGRQAIVPIHPTQTNKHGQIRYWTCLCEHRANPFTYPRNRAKRVRSSPSSD